jgi:Protein of unknown function (DUF1573)
MLRFMLALVAAAGLAAPVSAESWADALFDDLVKDFGPVQRGPAVSHPFRLTNTTGQHIHIAGVRVSCGCTSASAAERDVPPGKSTVINATMDTRRFIGHKQVTIYVTLDQPQWEEVRLVVRANGRDDLSLTPESFALGQARRGTTPGSTVNVTFYGSRIIDVEKESNYIQTSVKEVSRDGGSVNYEVTASVRNDCPVGKWYSDVWLKTNNPSMPRVRVPLTVEIQPALSVTPATVALGTIKPGDEVDRKVIVRGTKPFRITKVQGIDDQLSVTDSTKDSKEVHILSVKLKASKTGDLIRRLKVVTDLKEEGAVEFETTAQVID